LLTYDELLMKCHFLVTESEPIWCRMFLIKRTYGCLTFQTKGG